MLNYFSDTENQPYKIERQDLYDNLDSRKDDVRKNFGFSL